MCLLLHLLKYKYLGEAQEKPRFPYIILYFTVYTPFPPHLLIGKLVYTHIIQGNHPSRLFWILYVL